MRTFLFAAKKPSPKQNVVTPQKPTNGGSNTAPVSSHFERGMESCSLEEILALPLPKHIPDSEYDCMDIFTAASLNSETLQRYFGGAPGNSDKTAAEVSAMANAVNVHRWTPLMYAAYLGHKEASQTLLSRGANPEARSESGQTSLMMAASCGSTEIVNVLVRFFAKINDQDKYGRTPIHYAVKYNQGKIAGLLLECGADSNLPDVEGMTPTLMACEVGNETTVATLLHYNGDPNRCNKRGENGAKLALEHPKVLAILQNKVNCQASKIDNTSEDDHHTTSTLSENNELRSIIHLLEQLGLEKYDRNFSDHNISTFSDFASLNDEKLDNMGITLFGPKKKILNAVQQYRQFGTLTNNNNVNVTTNVNASNLLEQCQKPPDNSASGDYAQMEISLQEYQKELQHVNQLCTRQAQALYENKHLNEQVYLVLSQINAQNSAINGIPLANISTILNNIEQINSKIKNLLNES